MRQSSLSTHYLIKAIHLPRVVAYLLAALVTASDHFQAETFGWEFAGFLLVLLLYPHLAKGVTRRFANSASGAQGSLRVDAVLVGLLVIANEFHFLASVSFVTALIISSLFIGAFTGMLVNLLLLLITAFAGYWWLGLSGFGFSAMSDSSDSLVRTWLSGVFIITYSAIATALGYQVSRHLGQGRKQLETYQISIESLAKRLQPYVSPQIYQSIAANHFKVTRRRCLSVCFADIEGFTALMDSLPEELVTRILNDYLTCMAGVALDFGGTIDKFMGDGIMIFFGDPLSSGRQKDALACVEMALAMRAKLTDLRSRWQQEGVFSDIHIRIGIHTGECAVGNFGSAQRLDYTAIGSTVNIASRLEGRADRDCILISAETFALVEAQLHCLARGRIRLRGIQRDIDAYLVIGRLPEVASPPGVE